MLDSIHWVLFKNPFVLQCVVLDIGMYYLDPALTISQRLGMQPSVISHCTVSPELREALYPQLYTFLSAAYI